jgi:hypothetical protein
MIGSLILTLAFAGQAPARSAELDPPPQPRRTTQAQRIRARNAARARNNQALAEREAFQMRVNAIVQQRQYMEMLPYALENQRQMLNRQSDLERNAILNRALNGNGGIYVPPVTVMPQPVDNGNRMPVP